MNVSKTSFVCQPAEHIQPDVIGTSTGATRPTAPTPAVAAAPVTAASEGGHLPFTAGSKLLLERTLRESIRLGHNYVGTEHVLLALLDDEGTAGAALRDVGAQRAALEPWIVQQLLELTRPNP
jgi:hypothetical protein